MVLFSSRARQTYRTASDVDLALKGNVTNAFVLKIKDILEEETNISLFFDVLVYANINNNEWLQHIDREGIVIYTKEKKRT